MFTRSASSEKVQFPKSRAKNITSTSPARPFPEHVEGPEHGHPGRGVPSDAVLPAVFITYRLEVVGIPQDIPLNKGYSNNNNTPKKKWIDFNQQMMVL